MNGRFRISRFSVYSSLTALAAAVLLAASASSHPVRSAETLVLLILLTAVAESLTVAGPGGGSLSVAYPVSVAALLLFGPTAGALVAAFSGVSLADLKAKRPIDRAVFNVGQLVVAATLAGWVFLSSGGRLLSESPLQAADFPFIFVPVMLLALVSVAVNSVLVSAGFSILTGKPPLSVWTRGFLWAVPTQIGLSVMGLAFAQVIGIVGPLGLVLFAVPLLVSRQLYVTYGVLAKSYTDTIRSLVRAIEAKDTYTRGHSERVADYAMGIAHAMGLPQRECERLEIAAILHDLGKIGIRESVLKKDGRLTDEEYAEIKAHPRLGAEILESVEFLSDILPAVVYHHERYDGHGYCSGLAGIDIPLHARILAVADSYDAMTSKRAYRDAMSHEDALLEVMRCSGTQFDPAVVDVFVGLDLVSATPGNDDVVSEMSVA